ncbi:helix-turn-helix domain-containing protein [Geobacter pelophilus]|uniref:Helix-turn-helix domain-containing protein n=1 Tax=Geoanaerobacter pelophilus TaxID=60036 RepID=A0AAW4L3Z3_9BACT|nr:helix-turn-helix domain-containing protein [Geoanaerobacter pelophilus]MBT0665716.1 helix-turn-helix domain-containing protein [Geoanaerobacter pelophilus]
MSRHTIPKKPEQRREWIKYQLRLNGSSFSAIAKERGVSRQAVQLVNYCPSPKWEGIIAQKIGTTPEQIWPERYAA